MTTINQLSEADTLANGDQLPIFSEAQGDTRKVNFLTLKKSVAGEFVSLANLAAQTGARLVGTADGTTVQQALDARPTSTALALSTGATLIGSKDGAGGTLWTTVAGFISRLLSSAGSSVIGFIQSGTGAVAETAQDALRRVIHQAQYSSYANAKTAAGNTKVLIASPQTNSGIVGAKTRPGIVTGHMVIGDTDAVGLDPDAFVGLFADEKYSGAPTQEMRGLSYTIRYDRQSPDEPTLGWDVIPVLGATVVGPENTQYIRGNMKSVVGELIFQKPTTGTYTVLTSHNWQAITYVEQNVTLTNWYGGIVNRPIYNGASGGTITNGYGLLIDNLLGGGVTFTNIAAIKIDGVGNAGRIWWGDSAWITKDSSGKVELSLNSQPLVLQSPTTTTSATAGGASALPAIPSGYLSIIIGGTVRKMPYYEA